MSPGRIRSGLLAALLAVPVLLSGCVVSNAGGHGKEACGNLTQDCSSHPKSTKSEAPKTTPKKSQLPQPQENYFDACPIKYANDADKGNPHYAYDGTKKLVCKNRDYDVQRWEYA
jgi:hypothetical protein